MDPSLARRMRMRLLAGLLTAGGTLSSLAVLAAPARAAASDSLTVTITPKDIWPPAPVTDLVGTPGAEGQMLLQWTAPDSNDDVFPTALSPAALYQIRVATFSVDSVGASTTAWWNGATDVGALPPPALAALPPVPAFPGTPQSLLLSQLEPGVTYYAMLVSRDAMGLVSDSDVFSRTPGAQAQALVFDAAPPAPTNLAVAQTGTAAFTVTWSSPTAYDLDFYRLSIDSTSPYDFAGASVVVIDSPTLSIVLTGLSTGTYHFRVTAVDQGVPSFRGLPLESAPSAEVVADLLPVLRPPQEPYGVAISTGAGGVTLRWKPVVRYADGGGFVIPAAPSVDELSGYRVYRATSPLLGTWTEQVSIPASTLVWTDLAGGPQHYYLVRSENSSGMSLRSIVRTMGSRSAFVVDPDDASVFEILAQDIAPIEGSAVDPMSAYLVRASSRPEDLGGRVVKSLEFKAWKGGQALAPDFAIDGLGWLRLRYALSGSSVAPSAFAAAVPPTPQNMSVYWYNGRGWVQLYGKLDAVEQTMTVQTKFFGRYQLRTVERAGGFAFNQAGVSNRRLTPNGDGRNDNAVFTYDNPRDAAVTIRILDLRGKLVVSDLPPGPISNSKVWDASAGGRTVPGGIYIYQVESEGRVYSGTIVIVK